MLFGMILTTQGPMRHSLPVAAIITGGIVLQIVQLGHTILVSYVLFICEVKGSMAKEVYCSYGMEV